MENTQNIQHPLSSLPPSGARLLRVPDVLARLQVSRAHLYTLIAAGTVPAPIKLGRAARWREADIEQIVTGGGKTHLH
ncbi:MAG TPA: AlpA family phage regulatory protein [Castellaniella sp.]|jgi:prophage regulatory protein|nr:AlpA family phage regulatory protein [Castellaniella sp.]